MEVLEEKIINKDYIYGPFGKVESYGRIEEYIRENNGSNPFHIGQDLILYFSQGYAIRYCQDRNLTAINHNLGRTEKLLNIPPHHHQTTTPHKVNVSII